MMLDSSVGGNSKATYHSRNWLAAPRNAVAVAAPHCTLLCGLPTATARERKIFRASAPCTFYQENPEQPSLRSPDSEKTQKVENYFPNVIQITVYG